MEPPNQSQSDRIVTACEDEILAGRLLPGDRLDERGLAERFQVSRTPVREALQRMAANGVVRLAGRQGARVMQLDLADLLDAFVLIAEFEAVAAGQAARRRSPEDLARIEEFDREAALHAREGTISAFNDANDRYHAAIMAASRNRILQAQVRTSQLLTSAYRHHATRLPGRMIASIAEHDAITRAIGEGCAESAARHMRAHVNHLAEGVGDFLHQLRGSRLSSDVLEVAPAPERPEAG